MTNNSHQILIDYFEKIAVLDENERKLVRELFVLKTYKRKEFLLKEGDICQFFNFVTKGCARMYLTDDKANTHILQFASENWIITDVASFRQKVPSKLTIDALESTEILQINHAGLQKLYDEAPKFNRIIRELLEKHLITLQKRLLQQLSSTGEERYSDFLKTYPHLANRLPQTQIASFLGVTPEYLSKIRKNSLKSN